MLVDDRLLAAERHGLNFIKRAVEHNILGPEGQKMQAEVWKEVLAILEENVPEARGIAHPPAT